MEVNYFQNMLVEGKVKEFVNEISAFADPDMKNTLILLQGQWNTMKRNNMLGIVSYENLSLERNQIVNSLLLCLNDISKNTPHTNNKNKKNMNIDIENVLQQYQKIWKKVQFSDHSTDLKNAVKNLISDLTHYRIGLIQNELYDVDGKEMQQILNKMETFSSTYGLELEKKEKVEVAQLKKIVGECQTVPSADHGKKLAETLWLYDSSKDFRQRFDDASRIGGGAMFRVMGEMAEEVETLWEKVKHK